MERQGRVPAPFLRSWLNNYRQDVLLSQPENTIISRFQVEIADNIFSLIMLRLSYPGRHDCGHVMRSKSRVIICQNDLAFLWMRHDTSFEVIAYCPYRSTAKVLIHADMAPDKGVHLQFARHGRALMGASPEHAQVVGNV